MILEIIDRKCFLLHNKILSRGSTSFKLVIFKQQFATISGFHLPQVPCLRRASRWPEEKFPTN